jgi:hypothetical protein
MWTLAYQYLPANWKGIFTLALLTPQVNIMPNNQALPILLMAHTQSKRAIQVIPLLIGLGINSWNRKKHKSNCLISFLL